MWPVVSLFAPYGRGVEIQYESADVWCCAKSIVGGASSATIASVTGVNVKLYLAA